MLLVIIVRLGNRARLLGAFATDQNFAACLLFQTLLVETFRPNYHANIVDAVVLWDVDLLLDLVGVDHCAEVRVVLWLSLVCVDQSRIQHKVAVLHASYKLKMK